MSYSVGLYFDRLTETKIRAIWKEMAEAGVSDYLHQSANRPHFTLAIFTEIDLPKAKQALAEIAAAYPPLPVVFSYLGCFPALKPDLFLGPTTTQSILTFHQTVNRRFTGLGQYPDFNYYLPGHWVPHCALAMGIEPQKVNAGLDIARSQLTLPFTALIEEIGLIEFKPVRHLCNYPLGGYMKSSEDFS